MMRSFSSGGSFVWRMGLTGVVVTAAASAGGQAEPPRGFAIIERQANVYTHNSQEAPTVAVDGEGRALVVWGSRRQENGAFGIFARLFDEAGNPIEGELHLNQHVDNNQEQPAAAFGPDGTAWVTWQSFGQDGDGASIVLRRFGFVDGMFVALSNEIIVNERVVGDQTQPTVAAGDSGAIVSWTTVADERQFVAARLFGADGEALTSEITVARGEGAHHWMPAAASRPAGEYLLAWASRGSSGETANVHVRRVSRAGELIGDPIAVAQDSERINVEPSIGADAKGGFVVAWMGRLDDGEYQVIARRFDPRGVPACGEIVVPFGREQWRSGGGVAVAPDGRFVVAANLEEKLAEGNVERKPVRPADALAVLFDADGDVIDGPFVLNQHRDGRQMLTIGSGAPRAHWSADGRVAFVWQGHIGEDSSGVGFTALTPRGLSASSSGSVEPTLLAQIGDGAHGSIDAPPEFDPFFIPDPPDVNPLNPGVDFGFIGFQATGWTPPDPDLAVGHDHVVVAVNGGISFYTKDGTRTFNQPIAGSNGFWGSVGATSFVFDPVAVFDVLSGRYIVAATEHSDDDRMMICLAASDDGDPNGTWHKYRFDMTSVGGFIDFPNLGVGTNAIYITTDYFSSPTGNHIHIFKKSDVIAGLPTTPRIVRTSNGFRSLGAVKNYDNNPPAQFFATAFTGSNTRIQIDAIRTPNTTPVRDTFNLTVPFFTNPPGANQLGTSNLADTIDVRIKNGVYRNGMLWLAHTTGQDATARVRWYQVQMNGWPQSGQDPVLVQTGTQNLGPGIHNWFADIHVDNNGRVGLAFNQSSSQEFISVQRTFRLPADPLGQLREPLLMQVSTSPEPGGRWGDYAGVEEDPADPSVFWSHHEYRTTSWRTWVGRFDILGTLPAISFQFPDGLPSEIDSDGGTTFNVIVLAENEQPEQNTAVLHVDRGNGFEQFPMTQTEPHHYEATFPSTPCGTVVKFYVSAESTVGTIVNEPEDAPGSFFSVDSFSEIDTVFSDTFQTDRGWTVANENLEDGAWSRGVPAGDGSRGDPTSDFDGSGSCWLTDNTPGNSDVDGGPTRLTSPRLDCSGPGDHFISYARWFSNDDNDIDRLDVHLSDDDGATWTLVESVSNTGGWTTHRFRVADFVDQTSQVKIRFSATDNPNDSVTEAAIDAFVVESFACEAGATLTNVVVTTGTRLAGGLPELEESDDAYFHARSGFGATFIDLHMMQIRVEAQTTLNNPTLLDLKVESHIDEPSGMGRLRMRNWNTNQFEDVGSFAVGSTDTVRTIDDLDATKYVRESDGEMQVQVKVVVVAPIFAFLFDAFVDEVKFSPR